MTAQPVTQHQQASAFPKLDTPLVDLETGAIEIPWYRLLITLWQRDSLVGGNIVILVPGMSPFQYTATSRGNILVSPGAGVGAPAAVSLSRDGITFYPVSNDGGQFRLVKGDLVQVTWPPAGPAPTISWWPENFGT